MQQMRGQHRPMGCRVDRGVAFARPADIAPFAVAFPSVPGGLVETPLSLLERLQKRSSDNDWREFCKLYQPLVVRWARRASASYHEALDMVQEVFIDVHRNVAHFDRRGPGAFRGWLRCVLHSKLSKLRSKRFPELVDFDELYELLAICHSGDADRARYQELLADACAKVKPEFSELSWQAFERTFLEQENTVDVAISLGMTRNAVYVARCRIINRLKECIADNLI